MSHPYVEYEGRAIWRALDAALVELEGNRDLQLTTARRYVIGYLCHRLDRLGVLTWTHGTAAALALEGSGWPPAVAEGAGVYAHELAGMGDDRLIADYLRVREAEWADAPPQPLESYLPLARAILAAEAAEDRLTQPAT